MSKGIIEHRLEVIKSAQKMGISKAAELYSVDRSTIRRWIKKFTESGEKGLGNRSKVGLTIYKNQMPKDIEELVLSLKKRNPNISIDSIREQLPHPYSRSTIFKKLKQHGLAGATKSDLSEIRSPFEDDTPFTQFYISVKKIATPSNSFDHFNYQYLIVEKLTNIQFMAFSSQLDRVNITIFIDLFLSQLVSFGINPKNVVIIQNKLPKKLNKVVDTIIKRYGTQFEFIKDIPVQYSKSLLDKQFFADHSLYDKEIFLLKSYAHLMFNNTLQFNSFEPSLLKKIEAVVDYKRIVNKIIYKLYPIDLDSHYDVERIFSLKDYWSSYNDSRIYKDGSKEWITIGSKLAKKFENRKAIELYDTIISITHYTDDIELRVYSLIFKGINLQRVGALKSVEETFNSGLKLAKKYHLNHLYIKLLIQLGTLFHHKAEYSRGAKYLENSIKLSKAYDFKEDKINGLCSLVGVYLRMGDYNRAVRRYNTVLPLLKDSDPRKVTLYANHAVICEHRKQYSRSIDLYNLGLKIGRSIGAIRQLSQILNNLGNIYLLRYEDEKAVAAYKELLTLANKQGIKGWIGIAHNNIGRYYQVTGNFKDSLKHFKQYYDISEEIDDKNSKAISLMNMGEVYFELGSFKVADKEIDSAIKTLQECSDTLYLPQAHLLKGKILFFQENYFLANRSFKDSIKSAKKLESKDQLLRGLIYREVNKLFRIFEGYKRYSSTKEEQIIDCYHLLEQFRDIEPDAELYGEVATLFYNTLNRDKCKEIRLNYTLSIEMMKENLKRDLTTLFNKLYRRSSRKKFRKLIENFTQ